MLSLPMLLDQKYRFKTRNGKEKELLIFIRDIVQNLHEFKMSSADMFEEVKKMVDNFAPFVSWCEWNSKNNCSNEKPTHRI